MRFYRLRDEDKKYLYALLYATGIILFWRGIWEVSYEIPLLENVYFVLFVGLFILTITGLIYREFDVLGQRTFNLSKLFDDIIIEKARGNYYDVFWFDELKGHEHKIYSKHIRKMEMEFLVIESQGHDAFIPLSRIIRITKGKETIWKR